MELSIAVCTWKRPRLLRQALRSIARTTIPSGLAWEVVVVDNDGAGEVARVAEELAGRLPLRVVVEPRLGLSVARNRAVAEARGDYILWADDDVIVGPRWIAEYVAAFERHPDAVAFGGPIRARFEGKPPAWLMRSREVIGAAFAERDLGAHEHPLAAPERLPYGANFAVRMDAQRRHRFDPRLGRRGTRLSGGEELALLETLLDEGGEGWWVPRAGVEHVVPRERQTLGFLERYYREVGRMQMQWRVADRARRELLGRPLWLWRQLVASRARYLRWRLSRRPERWMEPFRELQISLGMWDATR